MQPVVVYDTNVLISGMIWGGVPYRSIELAQQNKVKGLICDEILDEFEDKLMIKLGIPSARTSWKLSGYPYCKANGLSGRV